MNDPYRFVKNNKQSTNINSNKLKHIKKEKLKQIEQLRQKEKLRQKANPRIIYYYETLTSLENIINDIENKITHIHVSNFELSVDPNTGAYKIYLNNEDVYANTESFKKLWFELYKCHKKGIKIVITLGGPTHTYKTMFKSNSIYYKCLGAILELIEKKQNIISGIDLDVEEKVKHISNIQRLIDDIDFNLGKKFIISMSVLSPALYINKPTMGDIIYKDLYNTKEGKRVNYFNCQFYDGDLSVESFKKCVVNGFPQEKIVIGVDTYSYMEYEYYKIVNDIVKLFNNIGGVFFWEYKTVPVNWSKNINDIINKESIYTNNISDTCVIS